MDKSKDEVIDMDFGDLEVAIDRTGYLDAIFSEAELSAVRLSPYDPATSVVPGKGEASLRAHRFSQCFLTFFNI